MKNRVRTIETGKWCEIYKSKIIIEQDILEKDIRGVYGFFIEDKCIYIGKGINIKDRVYDHLSKLKWLCYDIELKDVPTHITELKEAFDDNKIINVKVLEIVDYEYENYNRDLHHLAFREYYHIEEYQKKGQCLNQYPEGSFVKKENERWLKQQQNR